MKEKRNRRSGATARAHAHHSPKTKSLHMQMRFEAIAESNRIAMKIKHNKVPGQRSGWAKKQIVWLLVFFSAGSLLPFDCFIFRFSIRRRIFTLLIFIFHQPTSQRICQTLCIYRKHVIPFLFVSLAMKIMFRVEVSCDYCFRCVFLQV